MRMGVVSMVTTDPRLPDGRRPGGRLSIVCAPEDREVAWAAALDLARYTMTLHPAIFAVPYADWPTEPSRCPGCGCASGWDVTPPPAVPEFLPAECGQCALEIGRPA